MAPTRRSERNGNNDRVALSGTSVSTSTSFPPSQTRSDRRRQKSVGVPLKSALSCRNNEIVTINGNIRSNNDGNNNGNVNSTGSGVGIGVFGRVTKSTSRSSQSASKLGGLKRVKFVETDASNRGAFGVWNKAEEETNEGEDVSSDSVVSEAATATTTTTTTENESDVVATLSTKIVDRVAVTGESKPSVKRKRQDVDDTEADSDSSAHIDDPETTVLEQNKKRRVQLLSPPASTTDSEDRDDDDLLLPSRFPSFPRASRKNAAASPSIELPLSLLDLISLHAAFLRTLTLHYAHNGASSPAELGTLMQSVTRSWKRRDVQQPTIQRMLGLYELCADSTLIRARQAERKTCCFTIILSGLGTNVRTNLQYVGSSPYNEVHLQAAYSDMVHRCFRNDVAIEDVSLIPLLTITLGMQTSLHRTKTAATRAEILSLSASAQTRATPDFSKLSISDSMDHTPAAVKSRTLSLFDRVRAKGMAAVDNAAPTSEQIVRRHAIGRIGEVVDFLRMKQQQRLSVQFDSSVHSSPGKVRGTGKISFSLQAIVRDVRQSVGVPIGEETIRKCLEILSREIASDWCRMIEIGAVVSVTLQGPGMSGVEVKRRLEER